jgi:transposase
MKGRIEGDWRMKPRRQYTKEFKREAVRLSQQPGKGPARVAQELGISRSMVCMWITKAQSEGPDAFRGHGNRTELEAENAALQRRIRVLEEERDILKKAATWFAKQSE